MPVTLETDLRDVQTVDAKKLRKTGRTPVVIYGGGLESTMHLSVDSHTIEQALIKGEQAFELKIDGKPCHAIVKDLDVDRLTDELYHVDFMKINMEDKVAVAVPLVLFGDAKGVKEGGQLEQLTYSVEVNVRADAIPSEIVINITDVEIGTVMHMSEVEFPEGVELVEKEKTKVALAVHVPKAQRGKTDEEIEEEEAAAAAAATAAASAEEAS